MANVSRRVFAKLIGGTGAGLIGGTGLAPFAIAQGAAAARVVVIGGGAGGATVAHYLKKGDPKLDVRLVEARSTYTTGFFSNLVIGGFRTLESIQHGYDNLRKLGIMVIHELATKVDPVKKTVMLSSGTILPYDRLVLSPGIDVVYDSIEGYSIAASDIMPHFWKNHANLTQLTRQLDAMKDGGTVAFAAPNNPYRCPPGPYERVAMIAHYLKNKKPKSKLIVLDPKKAFSKQPVFTEAYDKYYKGIVEMNLSNDIDDFSVTKVDAATKTLTTKAGKVVKADVAMVVPKQVAGKIASVAGATEGDWCPVNADNFSSKKLKDVYVIGDATIADPMPKSAFSANSQGKVVAADILADLSKKEKFPARYRNTCWSLVAPDDCVKVGANYAAKDGKLEASGAFVSQRGEAADVRKQNWAEAEGWYSGIVADIFAKPAAPAAPATKGAAPAKKG
jgi:NADH dehydrogenase FAD-containing subunit